MPRLVWTEDAVAGLERIYAFLVEKDVNAAVKAVEAIDDGAKILADFPNAGRPAEDLEPEQRELPIPFGGSGYVVQYRVENSLVYILAVRHQKEAG